MACEVTLTRIAGPRQFDMMCVSVDGGVVCEIGAGETVKLAMSVGRHSVQVARDRCMSVAVTVSVGFGVPEELYCHAPRTCQTRTARRLDYLLRGCTDCLALW